jgi:CRISPR-associated protein Csb2
MSPVVIRVTLLSGRYHAHPWGQAQHAMGGPEWPPSPWRFLRTIAACWFEAAEPPCSAEERDDLLNAIGQAEPPRIWIPRASFSELPCYQPVTKEVQRNVEGKKVAVREINSRVLHYDHFAVVADPDVFFVFDTDLTDEQRSVLSRLLSTARYFGRTESRASFALAEPNQQKPADHYEARPPVGEPHGRDTIRRHVLLTKDDFTACDLWQVRQMPTKGKTTAKSKSISSGIAETPPHFVEAVIAAKRPVPDGTRWVQYELRREAIVHELPRRRATRAWSSVQPAAEVVFRLFRRVPVPILDTVLLARDFRDQAVRAYTQAKDCGCVLLSGREEDGSVARGNRHAYYLPQPTGSSGGFLERLVVRFPGGEHGVDQDVLDAILGVTRLLKRDTYPVLVVPEEVRPASRAPTAFRWRSLTPFLAPLRHRPRREQTDPAKQMLQALRASVSIGPKVAVGSERQVVPVLSHLYDAPGSAGRPRHRFTRRAGFTFDLEFPEPVELPVAIGADAHFGLGQFEPYSGCGDGE